MVLELDRRYPGLGRQIEESMAVAIDGEIFQDAYLAHAQPRERDLPDPENRRRLTAPLRLMTTPARGGEHRGETADRFILPAVQRRGYRGSTPFPSVAQSRGVEVAIGPGAGDARIRSECPSLFASTSSCGRVQARL